MTAAQHTQTGRGRGARLARGLLWTLLGLLTALGGAALWLRGTVTPRTTGTLTAPGLSGPVTVTRDAWGVPHIRAGRSDEDAVFALGYVHWQDRAWQMDFQRRVAQGRLSEVLGSAALAQDRFLRTWGFQRAAASALPALSARSRRLIRAYTAGVNAAMAAPGKRALEFRLLGYVPEPWADVDSVSWSKLMAYDLGGNWDEEVLGARVLRRLGAPGLAQVTPPYPASGPTILSADELNVERGGQNRGQGGGSRPGAARPQALPGNTLRALQAHLDAARTLGLARVPGKGSNNWVVGGRRTASGKPLLADDPHLALSAPMLWYLADVQGPGLRVIGASIPGLPSVVIGRNDRVAWGVTNVNPDVQDLYVEPASAPLTSRTERIRVKGGPDVTLVVRESAHGPIISDGGAVTAGNGAGDVAREVGPRVALRWTALDPGDTTLDAFLDLNYARDWPEFKAALRRYVAPSQSFVYADVDGNTGYYAPGRVPVRARGDGSLPVPGDGRHEWTGAVPFDALPHTFNPPDALIVTANNRVVPGTYPFTLGNPRTWAEPDRAARITALLRARPTGLTVGDMTRVQLDTVSPVWPQLRRALLGSAPADDLSRRAQALLAGWDGNETVDSAAATVFEAWLAQLQTLAQDELGSGVTVNSLAVVNALRSGALCHDDAAGIPDCAALLTRTLSAAATDLRARLGGAPRTWTYGRVHQVASDHRAFGNVGALAWLFNHRAPTPGGTNTVNVARPEPGTYRQTHGPSYRQVIDLAEPDRSVYVGSLGQGGGPLSPHAADQQARWIAGTYLPMSTRPGDWGRTQVLTLTPAP